MRRWLCMALLLASVLRGQAPVRAPNDAAADQKEDEERAALHADRIQSGIDSAQKDADDADAAIAPLLKKLTPVQRAAYERAEAAMQHFIDVQVTGDYLFMGGYGSGGLYPNEEHAAFENFVVDVLKKAPRPATAASYKAADDALNEVYTRLMKAAAPLAALPRESRPSYAVTPDTLRTEQRAWIAYRDAFVLFGRTLPPALPPSAWMLPLTSARTQDLRTFYDGNAAEYAAAAQRYSSWQSSAVNSQQVQTSSERQRVAEIMDRLTPAQSAAWQRVQGALDAFTVAHNASLANPSPTFRERQMQALYGELYAIQYNKTHGFTPDPQKAAEGFAKNDAALNAEYAKDLASKCLFAPTPASVTAVPEQHRTPELLRNEQRAWIKLRDAWVSFLEMLYPEHSPEALSNMLIGSRAFELRMLHEFCERTGQAPKEQ